MGYRKISIGSETVRGDTAALLATVQEVLVNIDPDILVVSTSEIIPTLYEMADRVDADFSLSRWPGVDYQQLASQSTYASYGQVGHSPARYNVPGRAIIDQSNTFFFGETNLEDVLGLVEQSRKPI